MTLRTLNYGNYGIFLVIYHNSHSLGYLKECRILSINRSILASLDLLFLVCFVLPKPLGLESGASFKGVYKA